MVKFPSTQPKPTARSFRAVRPIFRHGTHRSKSHHRLTRDAERLIALAQGLGASGSRVEDRFWEAATATLATRLIENGNDMPLESALDHLWTKNLPAYDGLVEAVEAASESIVIERDGARWQALLVAAPVIAWSRYAIPSGAIGREDAQALAVQLQGHVLADGTRIALSPWLYSIDQLPQAYSELLKLTQRLGVTAVDGQAPKVDAAKLPETAQMLADTRFVIAAVAAPEGAAHFRWQQDTTGHAGRTQSAEQWIAQARPTLAKLMPGCVFECLLPDAYYGTAASRTAAAALCRARRSRLPGKRAQGAGREAACRGRGIRGGTRR